jgi:predicted RNase H-like nuclease (RuvC/YqgF family)
MKRTTISKLSIALLAVYMFSCGPAKKEPNPVEDSLKNVASNLSGQLTEKESALQEFVTSFNEISENLNTIKEKEKLVINSSKGGDAKSKEQQIKDDIAAIYDLMLRNKNALGGLQSKLKKSNSKIAGLEQMITNLEKQIADKDIEIGDLRKQMEGLNIEIADLKTNVETTKKESEEKTVKLNTAYYVFGTKKELIEKKIISREGGFLGMGKSTKVTDNFDKTYFTKVDVSSTTEIPASGKKVKLLSNHPSGSYKLDGSLSKTEKILISDANEFWSNSKYLVVLIEN